MTKNTINFIRGVFKEKDKYIPLHVPTFIGNEKDPTGIFGNER